MDDDDTGDTLASEEFLAWRLDVIGKFNEEFGDDISIFENADELRAVLESRKREIENALSLDSGGDAPSRISVAIRKVENAVAKVNEISRRQAALQQIHENYREEVEKIKTKVENYAFKINELEKTCGYLKIIERIIDVSDMIEAGLNDKNEKKQETNFMLLKSIYKSLKGIKCSYLLTYAKETIRYWHNILRRKFGNEYVDILKLIKWPFVGGNLDLVRTPENINKLQILTEHLLNVQLDEDMIDPSESDEKPLSLPMTLLIKPLRKRFIYHFMGSRQTNRADKPEWYFTQVLKWMRNHHDFIEKNIQPVYDKVKKTDELAKIEFMRGLVQVTIKKLHYELSELQYDDSLFSHCIDEALGFDSSLTTAYGYPEDKPRVMDVLTQAPIIVKWINLEKRYALERMDRLLNREDAFDVVASWELDVFRVTESADNFLSLLSTIKDRYEMLPQPGHRLQFLQIELDLIDAFRTRLTQKLTDESSDPFESKFTNILNSIHYVKTILEDLGTNTFYLHLQFYKLKSEGREECEGSVFDDCLSLFDKVRDDFINVLADYVLMEIKAKSMPYRKTRWHALESPRSLIRPSVTPTACPIFQILINRLHDLEKCLATDLFTKTWSSLATKIDQYFYEEIVAICIFNEGGALQFNYDITKNLFPLFGQYSFKPETHFKLLKDSCVVLTMPIGVAMSLRETLENVEEMCDVYDTGEVMHEVGIFTMKRAEVLSLISRRTDIT